MTEKTSDLKEESNDEITEWIYYNNDQKNQENTNVNSFADIDTDQQLIYVDPADLVVHVNEQNLHYDFERNPQENIVNNTSEHNLILKETINENGQLEEEYFCQQCNMLYNSIEDFLDAHPSYQLLNENPETLEPEPQVEQNDLVTNTTENKLCELVENVNDNENNVDEDQNIEIKPSISQASLEDNDIFNNTIEVDNERYFCYDCQQVFADIKTAENHDCNNEYQDSNNYTESKSATLNDNNNSNNMYRCHLCDKDYTSFRSFSNHQRWHRKSEILHGHTRTLQQNPSVCEICNTKFTSEKNLKLHIKMHKKQATKTIQEALPVGAQSEYNDLNQFFCEICNKSFDQKLLIIHKNMHQNLEEYNCGKCNKKFENLPSYEIHMHMHVDNSNRKKNTTKETNKTIISEEVPSTSGGNFIDGGKRKHACQYCGKEFQRPYEKVKHERIHTGEKPYECEVCGKTFRVSYSLTLHLRTHTDIRPYVCTTCNKRFKQQSVYVHHLKTHDVECAYKCDICGKSFRTSVQLGGHKKIHSKPYNCTECNRPFASLYAVKIHMKTHNKCHKSNKNLKNRCRICGASYARIFALSVHIKEHHGINVDPAKLLATTNTNANNQRKIKDENMVLINAITESSNQELNFINSNEEENEVNSEDVDHEENIQNSLESNIYIDETEAATQAILNAEEFSADHFPTEEIITDWISK